MAKRPKMFKSALSVSRREQNREADRYRGSARARGYTAEWDKAAKEHLGRHPLCVYCELGVFGRVAVTPAKLVDHLIPHNGDQAIFWNRGDWVSSCVPCHSGPKQAAERHPTTLAALANAVRAARGGGASKP